MTGTEIYKRTPAYESEAGSIRLHAPEWKLLLAYDGQRSLAEVAMGVEMAFAEALPLTERFFGSGWIEEQPITLDQYLKRTGALSTSAIGSAVTPPVVLHEPKPELAAPAAVLASAVMEETAPAFRSEPSAPPTISATPPLPAPTPAPAATPAAIAPPLPAAPATPTPPPIVTPPPISMAPPTATPPPLVPKTGRGGMRLGAVVEHIVAQVGNNSLGQLVVYRIFLRVPPQLLQEEDIASVHLVNDEGIVRSEPLKQAILSSVMEVLKRPLPDSVFAPA
jgi:hypothetical protein